MFEPPADAVTRYADWTVAILTPHATSTSSNYWSQSVINMMAYSWRHGLRIEQIGVTRQMVVDWARNDLARRLMETVSYHDNKLYTHALWLDDDMVFEPDLAVYLASEMRSYDMISAVYYGRDKPLPVIYVDDAGGDTYGHNALVAIPEQTFPIDACGFGALLMRRDVFDRVPEPWFTIDYRGGEDIVFCKHARERGITIAVAGGYTCGHVTDPRIVTRADHLAYLRENPDRLTNLRPIDAGGGSD